jgi:hypothetical protein
LACLTKTRAYTSVNVLIMIIIKERMVIFSVEHHHVGALTPIIVLNEVVVVILDKITLVIKGVYHMLRHVVWLIVLVTIHYPVFTHRVSSELIHILN